MQIDTSIITRRVAQTVHTNSSPTLRITQGDGRALTRGQLPPIDHSTRGARNPLIPPSSYTLPASIQALTLPEFCAGVLDHAGPREGHALSQVSSTWQARAHRADIYMRYLGDVLGLSASEIKAMGLSLPERDIALGVMRRIESKLKGRNAAVPDNDLAQKVAEQLFASVLSPSLKRALSLVDSMHETRREIFIERCVAAGWVVGGTAGTAAGILASVYFYHVGWCATMGYAFDTAARAYVQTEPPAFYEKTWHPGNLGGMGGRGPDTYAAPETPTQRAMSLAMLPVSIGVICAAYGVSKWFSVEWLQYYAQRTENEVRSYFALKSGDAPSRG